MHDYVVRHLVADVFAMADALGLVELTAVLGYYSFISMTIVPFDFPPPARAILRSAAAASIRPFGALTGQDQKAGGKDDALGCSDI